MICSRMPLIHCIAWKKRLSSLMMKRFCGIGSTSRPAIISIICAPSFSDRNDLQQDAFDSLYRLEEKIKLIDDEAILRDWKYLQTSDHFYYMCTKFFRSE